MLRALQHFITFAWVVSVAIFFGASSSVFADRLCDQILADAERALKPRRVLDLGAGASQIAKQIKSNRYGFDPSLLSVIGPRDSVESLDMVAYPGLDYVGSFESLADEGRLGRYDTVFISNPFGFDIRDPNRLMTLRKHLSPDGKIVVVGSPSNRYMGLEINNRRVSIRDSLRAQAAEAGLDVSLRTLDQALVGQAGSHSTQARFMIVFTPRAPTTTRFSHFPFQLPDLMVSP